MATPDVGNISHGPAQFQLNDTEIGHTAGGVVATITPQNRPRVVDQFGASEMDIIHNGDEVRMTVPFAEWTADVLSEVYNPGNDQTAASSGATYLGIGRSAGYIYTTQSAKIIPRLSSLAAKRIEFHRVTPIGELSLNHVAEEDRLLEMEFACLTDEDQSDGERVGKLQVTAAA